MSEHESSQRWRGWWDEPPRGIKQHMSLQLAIGTAISGAGEDFVGQFSIQGSVNGEAVRFLKRYASHAVRYEGVMVSQKLICGTWIVSGNWCGSFRIWRDAETAKTETAVTSIEKENLA